MRQKEIKISFNKASKFFFGECFSSGYWSQKILQRYHISCQSTHWMFWDSIDLFASKHRLLWWNSFQQLLCLKFRLLHRDGVQFLVFLKYFAEYSQLYFNLYSIVQKEIKGHLCKEKNEILHLFIWASFYNEVLLYKIQTNIYPLSSHKETHHLFSTGTTLMVFFC